MKKQLLLICIIMGSILFKSCEGPAPRETEITKEERLEWFKEAKFGMFIHWGVYSKLAGEWKDQQVPVGENAEWIMHHFQIPVEKYRDVAATFNPTKFNAEEWVDLAKNTGMKYMVITSKHHDGFAMYPSEVSNYNILDYTPYDKDPMEALSKACREEGIRFGFYYSHREDWNHPYAYGNTWDFDSSQTNLDSMDYPGLFREYLEEKSKPQVKELLTNYNPRVMWFDRGMYTQEQGKEFVNLAHDIRPECLVNGRVGHYHKELLGDYQELGDREIADWGIGEYFETPMTLNQTWGYSKFDTTWKEPKRIIRQLVTTVSNGGNYLLNVGPTGKGEIPEASVRILKKVGQWMQKNSESIYGTTASPFADNRPWGRITRKGEKLYLHIFQWPEDQKLEIEGLNNVIRKAYMLVDKEKKLDVKRNDDQIRISLPSDPADEINSVAVLEIEGDPNVDPLIIKQEGNQPIQLECKNAITKGSAIKRYNRKGKYHISKWKKPEDLIQWHVDVEVPGSYNIFINYSARPEWEGQPYIVNAGENELESQVIGSEGWYEYNTFKMGQIEFNEKGKHLVKIYPKEASDEHLMYFKSMELRPIN
ncbi:MAG: alpha-L-fucosidase [Bacteroidales bacterium]|nr:alpha-L-fucosidase [Bacteroidales bacterium]